MPWWRLGGAEDQGDAPAAFAAAVRDAEALLSGREPTHGDDGQEARGGFGWGSVAAQLASVLCVGHGAGAGVEEEDEEALRALLLLAAGAPMGEERHAVFEALAQVVPLRLMVPPLHTLPRTCTAALADAIAALTSTIRETCQYASSDALLTRLRLLAELVVGILDRLSGAILEAPILHRAAELASCCQFLLSHDHPDVQARGVQAVRLFATHRPLTMAAAEPLSDLLPQLCIVMRAAQAGRGLQPPPPVVGSVDSCDGLDDDDDDLGGGGVLMELHRHSSGDLGADDALGSMRAGATTVCIDPGGYPATTLVNGLEACCRLAVGTTSSNQLIRCGVPRLVATLLSGPISPLRIVACEVVATLASSGLGEGKGESAGAGGVGGDAGIREHGVVLYEELFSEEVASALVAAMESCTSAHEASLLTKAVQHWLNARGSQVACTPGVLCGLLGFLHFLASTVELQIEVLRCIGPFLGDDRVRAILLDTSGVVALSKLMRSGSTEVVRLVLEAMEVLCQHDDVLNFIVDNEQHADRTRVRIVDVQSGILTRPDVDNSALKPFVHFLAVLLQRSQTHCVQLGLHRLLAPLLAQLSVCEDSKLLYELLQCLKALLTLDLEGLGMAEEVVSSQACVLLDTIVRQTVDLPEVQAAARDCLLALSSDALGTLFLDGGGVRALKTMSELPDTESRATAARWTRKMAVANDARLLKDVGLSALWRVFDFQLSSPVTEWWPVLANAMATVTEMIEDRDFQLGFCTSGGLEKAMSVNNTLQTAIDSFTDDCATSVAAPPVAVEGSDLRRASMDGYTHTHVPTIEEARTRFRDWLRSMLVHVIRNRDALASVVDGGGISILVDMLTDGQSVESGLACQALIRLSASRRLCEKIARGEDVMQRLLATFVASAGEVQTLLLDVLGNLIVADGNARTVALGNEEALKTVRTYFVSLSEATSQSAASRILCALVEHSEDVIVLARRWWLPFMLSCLETDDILRSITARKLAALSLSELSHSAQVPVHKLHMKIVIACIDDDQDQLVCQDLMQFMRMLSSREELATVLLSHEVACVDCVVSNLQRYCDSDQGMLKISFSTLANLLRHKSGIEQFVAMNGIKFLLTMLSTATDIDILDEVARAMYNCTKQTCSRLATAPATIDTPQIGRKFAENLDKIVAPLADGLRRGSRSVGRRGQAVKAHFLSNIWRVIKNLLTLPGDACSAFIAMDGIRLLVGYLTYDISADWRVRVQTAAAETMDTLCQEQPHVSQFIVEADGLNAVFGVLSDPRHCIARTNGIVAVVNVLSAMAENEQLCKKLIQRGTAPVVAPFLSYSFVATNAARVFFNMSLHRIHRSKLLECGVHEALMELDDDRSHASNALDRMLSDNIDGGEPAFWSAFTLAGLLDRDHGAEREDEIFESFPSLQEAEDWILSYMRRHVPDRQIDHALPPVPMLVHFCKSSVGVVQALGIYCACLMSNQKSSWSQYRDHFVGQGLWERLLLLLDALERSGSDHECAINIRTALRNAEAAEALRNPHSKVGTPCMHGFLKKQGTINKLGWRRHFCELVRGTCLLRYEESSAASATGVGRFARSLHIQQHSGVDAIRANREKRACCFEVHGFAEEFRGEAITVFFEAANTADMYEWILAIRRELAATELEALPSEIPEASTCPVSKSAVTFYSQEHNELLCDECVGKGRTPKGFAVIRDELLSLQAAEAEGIGRLETVIDSSYGLRDILVQTGQSMLDSVQASKSRHTAMHRRLAEEFSSLHSALHRRQRILVDELRAARRYQEDAVNKKLTRLENVVSEIGHQLAISEHVVGAAMQNSDAASTVRLLVNEKELTKSLTGHLQNLALEESAQSYVSNVASLREMIAEFGQIKEQ